MWAQKKSNHSLVGSSDSQLAKVCSLQLGKGEEGAGPKAGQQPGCRHSRQSKGRRGARPHAAGVHSTQRHGRCSPQVKQRLQRVRH